ncbi:hypothetical protein llap_17939 [Limosa lapponica baueri]|uniref:Uncharacterized protein n=1 Tax=Limosa lapponica baueri TaxID=1758121 RepID=A0A2I0TD87_LIMLA|nr:hypothetical protein llap_17939 [Limosa lapponica baueri]
MRAPAPGVLEEEEEDTLPKAREERQGEYPRHPVLQHGHLAKPSPNGFRLGRQDNIQIVPRSGAALRQAEQIPVSPGLGRSGIDSPEGSLPFSSLDT